MIKEEKGQSESHRNKYFLYWRYLILKVAFMGFSSISESTYSFNKHLLEPVMISLSAMKSID